MPCISITTQEFSAIDLNFYGIFIIPRNVNISHVQFQVTISSFRITERGNFLTLSEKSMTMVLQERKEKEVVESNVAEPLPTRRQHTLLYRFAFTAADGC